MGKNDVHLVMTAAEAQMVSAWMNARRSVGQFTNEINKAGDKGKKSGDDIQRAFSRAIKEIRKGFLTLFGVSGLQSTVRTFFQLIKSEFAAVRQEGEKAFGTQKDFGRQLRQIEILQPKGSDITTDEIAELIRTRSQGIPLSEMAKMVSTAITAGQGPDVRARATVPIELADFLSAFEGATSESIIQQVVAAMQQIPGRSARGQAALFTSALSASPSGGAQAKEFSENIFATATQAVARGFTQKEALSNLIALQFRSQDPEGATSRTNFLKLIEELDKRLKGRGIDIEGQAAIDFIRSKDPRAVQISKELLGSLREDFKRDMTLAEGEEDPKAKAELEARAKGRFALSELLQPTDTVTQRAFRTSMNQILEGPQGLAAFNARQEKIGSMMATIPEKLDLVLSQFANEIRGTGISGVRERLRKFIEEEPVISGDAALFGKLTAALELLESKRGRTDKQVFVEVFSRIKEIAEGRVEKERLRLAPTGREQVIPGAGFRQLKDVKELTPEDVRRFETDPIVVASRALAESMDNMTEQLKRNTDETARNTSETKQAQGQDPPIKDLP